MSTNIDLLEYKTKIANTVDDLIPCEWNNFAVYAEVSEENNQNHIQASSKGMRGIQPFKNGAPPTGRSCCNKAGNNTR